MRCHILRHVEKEKGDFYNPGLRHQDEPISQKGRLDAQKLIPYFADGSISAIYISRYLRTLQTVEPLARHLHLTPIRDDRLNEVDNGLFEGLTEQGIQRDFPGLWDKYRRRSEDFRFPGGESGEEAKNRIMEFLRQKTGLHASDSIVLVSHDGLIRSLMCGILGIPVTRRWNFQTNLGGITEIVYQGDFETWKLIRFNQTCAS